VSRLPSEYGGFGENFLHTAGPYQYATNASLRLTGRDLLAPCAAPVISLDFSRSYARGRSDLHSPKDASTSQTHASPGIRQDRRGTNAASPPFPPNGVSRLAATDGAVFRQQLEGVSWPRATFCIGTQDPRARSMGRVTSRPRYSARGAKVGLRGEFGGTQLGGESGRHCYLGMGQPVRRAVGTQGTRAGVVAVSLAFHQLVRKHGESQLVRNKHESLCR